MTTALQNWYRAAVIASFGAALIVGIGWLSELWWIGSSSDSAFRKVERHVQDVFTERAASLKETTQTLAAHPEVSAAISGNRNTLRELFDVTRPVVASRLENDLAITVYDVDATAKAWAGRPSEIPRERILAERTFFVAPGPLGLRLVYIEPVVAKHISEESPSSGQHLGSVAGEWLLSPTPGLAADTTDTFHPGSPIAPVTLRPIYEGGGALPEPLTFLLRAPTGQMLLEAQVSVTDLRYTRIAWRRAVLNTTLAFVALVLLLAALPELARVPHRANQRQVFESTAVAMSAVLLASGLLWAASTPTPGRWALFSVTAYTSVRVPTVLRSPADLLVLATLMAGVTLTLSRLVQLARLAWRHRRWPVDLPGTTSFVLVRLGAGAALAIILVAFHLVLADIVEGASVDVLHTSIHPWDSARLGLLIALLALAGTAMWTGVTVLLAAQVRWRDHPRTIPSTVVAWSAPGIVIAFAPNVAPTPYLVLLGGSVAAALAVRRARPWFRHASQAGRMVAIFAAFLLPALLVYPSLVHGGLQSKRRFVESQYGQQAVGLPAELLDNLTQALGEIDDFAELTHLTAGPSPPVAGRPDTDRAFLIWRQTELARRRLTSALEFYRPDGALVSRFALNLPEYSTTAQRWQGTGCDWDIFGEAARFGSQERNILHAERALCAPSVQHTSDIVQPGILGVLVVHVALDYQALSFISSQSPYFEFLRPTPIPPQEGHAGQNVELVIYGWGLSQIFSSGQRAWPIDDALFDRIYLSREPFWTIRSMSDRDYEVYFLNNRAGIYALGYPVSTAFDHLVRLAETTALVGLVFLISLGTLAFGLPITPNRHRFGRALLREIRTSFYRRLFLAFVAGAVIPVLALALVIRNYFTAQLRTEVEAGAARTAAVAQRVIEESFRLQQAAEEPVAGINPAAGINDDLLLRISQLIDQHVNIFEGSQLVATSERDLFTSGLLPTRTPAAVYNAIALEQLPSFVADDAIGSLSYLVAATPIRAAGQGAILTMPLASRQQEIERQIDDLDRSILLVVTLFILLGAGGGFYMAERIADPVKRLTLATKRIARGDFDAQVAARSSDELERLVSAFNRMAEDLKDQRRQLERTHRLEAWAEMARQVAHEIKNPLTPVQLSAEHLLRVHADHGEPLTPVLQSCVESILKQVRILRQISAEFSSYASSPRVQTEPTLLDELVAGVLKPYLVGLEGRVRIIINIPDSLPRLNLDQNLVARALTNIVENALHAMPDTGSLELCARQTETFVQLDVRDTGVGLDEATRARIFEPYFSTRAAGTGLGMAIAKRNIELNNGTITVESKRGHGTIVALTFPLTS